MPSIIINGTTFPIRQELAYDYDPQNGFVFKQRFAGAGLPEMISLSNQFAAAGVRYELNYTGGVAHLHVEDSSAQVPIDTWTVAQNEISKSALDNPLIKAACFPDDLITIAKMQTGEIGYDEALAALIDDTDNVTRRLIDAIKLGSTDFAMSGTALRHTTNVGNRFAANVSDFNMDAIYTTSLMLSETTDPASWIYPLPGRLVYKMQTIANDFITRYGTHTGYLWGWLKRGSTEGSTANNRVNITTEYWFDEWSTDRYSIAT